jgi:SPP1 family predicted phage head-tail adaptor
MDSGQLNRRVQVLERTAVRDGAGGQSETWDPIAERWASIDIQYSALTYETSEFMAKATYRIVLLYDKTLGLKIEHRIGWTDPSTDTKHVYEIESIPPDPRREKLMLLCYELDGSQ